MHPDKPILPGRCGCIAPGCKRTFKLEPHEADAEVICGKCWRRLVPARLRHRSKVLKARWRKMVRLERRKAIQRRLGTRQAHSTRWELIRDLFDRNWQAIKTAVLEASAGI